MEEATRQWQFYFSNQAMLAKRGMQIEQCVIGYKST